MGNRLGHAATACVLLGLLTSLAYVFVGWSGSCTAGSQQGGSSTTAAPTSHSTAASCLLVAHKAKDSTGSACQESSSDDGEKKIEKEEEEEEEEFLDPMGPNAACYVCHMTFIFEELSKIHLKEKVTCVECHGTSAAHANDEDIGATKPDRTYKRSQVSPACRKCHEEHVAKPEKVIARWIEIGAPKQKPVCTDCHGTHRIERPEPEKPEEDENATDPSDVKAEK